MAKIKWEFSIHKLERLFTITRMWTSKQISPEKAAYELTITEGINPVALKEFLECMTLIAPDDLDNPEILVAFKGYVYTRINMALSNAEKEINLQLKQY